MAVKAKDKIAFIYVLQCNRGKYYVGKTVTPRIRFETHFDTFKRNSVIWCDKYPPREVILLLQVPKDEDFRIHEESLSVLVAEKVGIDKVRGGLFYSNDSDEVCKEKIRMFRKANKQGMAQALRSLLPYSEATINKLADYDEEEEKYIAPVELKFGKDEAAS
jgi:predicted GIY-YIG superfamily endonuclease